MGCKKNDMQIKRLYKVMDSKGKPKVDIFDFHIIDTN